MYETHGLGETPDGHTVIAQDANYAIIDVDKDLIDQQIAQAVRLAQKNKVSVDYNGMLNNLVSAYGNGPDVDRLRNLFVNLESTNPYK